MTSHDCARALLAMPPFPMSRVPTPPKTPVAGDSAPKNAKYKGKPESEFAKRLHALYNRRPETLWTVKEVGLLKELMPSYNAEDMTALERYYKTEMAKGDKGIWRRNLETLLGNWNGELDRARAHAEASQRKIRRSDVKPDNVVLLIDPEREEKIRQQATAGLEGLRKAL